MLPFLFWWLVFLAAWNTQQVVLAIGDWLYVHRAGVNGSRQVISIGIVRAKLMVSIILWALLLIIYPRAIEGQPASPQAAGISYLVILSAATVYVVGGWLDRVSVRWFLRKADGGDGGPPREDEDA